MLRNCRRARLQSPRRLRDQSRRRPRRLRAPPTNAFPRQLRSQRAGSSDVPQDRRLPWELWPEAPRRRRLIVGSHGQTGRTSEAPCRIPVQPAVRQGRLLPRPFARQAFLRARRSSRSCNACGGSDEVFDPSSTAGYRLDPLDCEVHESRFLPQRHFQALIAAVVQLNRIASTRSSIVTAMAIQAACWSSMP